MRGGRFVGDVIGASVVAELASRAETIKNFVVAVVVVCWAVLECVVLVVLVGLLLSTGQYISKQK